MPLNQILRFQALKIANQEAQAEEAEFNEDIDKEDEPFS